MEAREYRLAENIIIELHGRVDEFSTNVLQDELNTILNTGRSSVVIDLEKSEFVSAHCLRALWKCHRRAQELGGHIVLAGPRGQIQETIQFVNLTKVMPVFENVEKATRWLQDVAVLRVTNPHKIHQSWIRKFLEKILRLFPFFLISFLQPSPLMALESEIFTLEDILTLAKQESPEVRISRMRMMEKEADVLTAKASGKPRIIGTIGYLYQSNPNIASELVNRELNNLRNQNADMDPEALKTRTNLQFDKSALLMGVGFAQTVYSGSLHKNELMLREAQRNEASAALDGELLKMEEQVRTLYVALVISLERIQLIEKRGKALGEKLKSAQAARQQKTIGEYRVAELEVLKLKCDLEMVQARREERSSRALLNIAMGRQPESPLVPRVDFWTEETQPESGEIYVERAINRYPDLRKSIALMDSASAYETIARIGGIFSPQALMFGSVDYTQGLGAAQKKLSYTLGMAIVLPLYDGQRTYAEFSKSKAMSMQAREAFQATEKKLRMEINDILIQMESARLNIEISKRTVEMAGRRIADAKIAVTERQTPQHLLSDTEAGEYEAKLILLAARSELFRQQSRLVALTGAKRAEP